MSMQGIGQKLRRRAQELELSDAEVARRVGISQARYQHYVVDRREPDLGTFIRICKALATTPNAILGFDGEARDNDEQAALAARIYALAGTMSDRQLRLAKRVFDAILLDTEAV